MEAKDSYICYNRAGADWVGKLAEQIESESIDGTDSGRRLCAFFDRWDIDAGQSLIDQMNAGMEAARHVVVVLSPEFSKQSPSGSQKASVVSWANCLRERCRKRATSSTCSVLRSLLSQDKT